MDTGGAYWPAIFMTFPCSAEQSFSKLKIENCPTDCVSFCYFVMFCLKKCFIFTANRLWRHSCRIWDLERAKSVTICGRIWEGVQYTIQNIDVPTLLAELLYGPPMLLNVCDNFIYTFIILEYQISRSCFYTEYESMNVSIRGCVSRLSSLGSWDCPHIGHHGYVVTLLLIHPSHILQPGGFLSWVSNTVKNME